MELCHPFLSHVLYLFMCERAFFFFFFLFVFHSQIISPSSFEFLVGCLEQFVVSNGTHTGLIDVD